MSSPNDLPTSTQVTVNLPTDPAELAHAETAQKLNSAYVQAAQGQMSGLTDDIPSDLKLAIKHYIWKATTTGDVEARTAKAMLGTRTPALVSDPQGTVYSGYRYNARTTEEIAMANTALANVEANTRKLETDAQQEAAQLVAEVLRQTQVPARPMGMSEGQALSAKADLTALLDAQPGPQSRQAKALQIVTRAAEAGDLGTLSVLLGNDMALVRERLGLEDIALLAAAFQGRMAYARSKYPPTSDPRGLVKSPYRPPAADWLARQFDPNTALGATAMHAAAKIRHAGQRPQAQSSRSRR